MATLGSIHSLRRFLRLGVACLAFTVVPAQPAAALTSAGIIASTVAAIPSCLQWRLEGVCVWLSCGLGGCSIVTTPRVSHYNPDAVVSAYQNVGENPWLEIRLALGIAQKAAANAQLAPLSGAFAGGGHQHEGRFSSDARQTRYKEADIIGHPLASLTAFADVANVPLLCPMATTSLFPYFQSSVDALSWRFAIPETFYPQALVPGIREIGNFPLNTWGSVYPRSGFVSHPEDAKAAAVVAQRAGDIATRTGQPHLYVPLPTTGGSFLSIFNPGSIPGLGSVPGLSEIGSILGIPGSGLLSGIGSLTGLSNTLPLPDLDPPEGLSFFGSGYHTQIRGPLREGNASTGKFQPLSPSARASCETFGRDDRFWGLSGWSGGRTDAGGDYAWNLWRHYTCCRRAGKFLGTIP